MVFVIFIDIEFCSCVIVFLDGLYVVVLVGKMEVMELEYIVYFELCECFKCILMKV